MKILILVFNLFNLSPKIRLNQYFSPDTKVAVLMLIENNSKGGHWQSCCLRGCLGYSMNQTSLLIHSKYRTIEMNHWHKMTPPKSFLIHLLSFPNYNRNM
ncbi:hypothetical protein DSY4033 [Desulfitobacterium hafniense Y51]|uniref:Uncharacterized protein n=1 Tax=Desulfitobacterium hafniense (strain Y51) TaxID=138119 RepID=Q24Q70_DESHY|nr:hypothetical protein DSY4033 [Desulfitobacterium hafniense Y51]